MKLQPIEAAEVCVVAQFDFSARHEDIQYCGAFALAQHLAARGDTVTFLLVPAPNSIEPSSDTVEDLRAAYLENWLVRLKVLTASRHVRPGLDHASKCSISLYHHLQENRFDIVYITLEGGLPHFSVTAKRTGVFKNPPPITVLAYEPSLWRNDAERKSVQHKDELTVSFMERTSAEQCDHLIAQCDSVIAWMRNQGWNLPKSTVILQPLVRRDWQMPRTASAALPKRELVHIGGGEAKNDLALFCDAIDKLLPSLDKDTCITFLGPFGNIAGEHSGGMALRRAANWPFRLRLLPLASSHEIFQYISARSCLVVFSCAQAQIPLYLTACLYNDVPFISTDVGGIPALVDSARRASVLCAPRADEIATLIRNGLPANHAQKPVPEVSYQEVESAWDTTHRNLLESNGAHDYSTTTGKLPLVSIVLVHYNRHEHLRGAIASIERQDYSRIEVVLVDDGSTSPEAINLLRDLEEVFAARKWQIVRQSNQFLGAARNAGIRNARGECILFLDDDNLLFPFAISTLVEAMDRSGADICTALAKYLYDQKHVPPDTSWGRIEYLPVGGPADIALFNNPYGDANALIRREVFDAIGFLNEQRGLSASDWEFFLRADLAMLKIAVVPEALYWYRSDPEGMNRNVNWVGDRRQLINAFSNKDVSTLRLLLELSAFQNLDWNEKNKNEWNLDFRVNDPGYRQLGESEPNAGTSIELLSLIAARNGRPDTAIELVSHTTSSTFQRQADSIVGAYFERSVSETDPLIMKETALPLEKLKLAHIYPRNGRLPLSYTKSPDQFYLETMDGSPSVVLLKSICPVGTVSVSGWVFSPENLADPLEFMLLAMPSGSDPLLVLERLPEDAAEGCSGWVRVSGAHSSRQIHAALSYPAGTTLDLVMAVRSLPTEESQGQQPVFGSFQGLTYRQGIGGASIRRPRTAPPRERQAPRALTDEELQTAVLTTSYEAELPLLLFDRVNGGIFLRPHPQGPVAAMLPDLFPPHATGVSALVEIAHEEASPFEFGLALLRQGEELNWERGVPANAVTFSGWIPVSEKFELQELGVAVCTISTEYMSIYLMIRLPKGSSPSPANAFWRRVIIQWGQ